MFGMRERPSQPSRKVICSQQTCLAPVRLRWQWAEIQACTSVPGACGSRPMRMARQAWSRVSLRDQLGGLRHGLRRPRSRRRN